MGVVAQVVEGEPRGPAEVGVGRDDGDEVVGEQRRRVDVGRWWARDRDVEVDRAVAQRVGVLGVLGDEPQADVRCLGGDPAGEARGDDRDQAVVEADRERAPPRARVGVGGAGPQAVRGVEQRPDRAGGTQGERGGDQTSARPHQDRVVERAPQPPQRATGRRGRQVQALGGLGDAAGVHQRVEHAQQVEVQVLRHDRPHSCVRRM